MQELNQIEAKQVSKSEIKQGKHEKP